MASWMTQHHEQPLLDSVSDTVSHRHQPVVGLFPLSHGLSAAAICTSTYPFLQLLLCCVQHRCIGLVDEDMGDKN
jgi:hypothetical protein